MNDSKPLERMNECQKGRMCRQAGAFPFLVSLLLVMPGLPAQETDEEVFELSAFEVSVSEDRGYFSPNSIVATGFAQEIYKTPLNIATLTDQFLQDTGIDNLDEAVNYMSGVQAESNIAEPQGTFRIRGFTTERSSRNGIRQYSSVGSDNVDRVEVIKGPASVFFGQVSPGGVINYTTKRASFDTLQELKLKYGSYDYKRVELSSQGPLFNDKLAYRLNGSWLDKEDWRDFEYEERWFGFAGLQWKPLPRMKVFIEYEYVDSEFSNAFGLLRGNELWVKNYRSPAPELVDVAVTYPQYDPNRWTPEEFTSLLFRSNFNRFVEVYEAAYGTSPGSFMIDGVPGATPYGWEFNQHGPGSFGLLESKIFTAEMNWMPLDWFALKLLHTDNRNFRFNLIQPGSELLTADGGIFGPSASASGNNNEATHSAIEGVFDFEWGPVSHRLLLGASYYQDDFNKVTLANAVPAPGWVNNWNPTRDGYIDLREAFDMERGFIPGSTVEDNFIRAYYASYVGSFFDDRLTFMTGIRDETFAKRKFDTNADGSTNADATQSNDFTGTTPMAGVVYEVRDGYSLFASYSEGYLPGQQSPVSSPDPETYLTPAERAAIPENQEGLGIDVGLKMQAMDNRLSGTVSLFQVERSNSIATRDRVREAADPRNNGGTENNVLHWTIGGNSRSRGLEADFIFSASESLEVVLGYAWMWEAEVLERPDIPEQEGSRLANSPDHSGSLWTKYTFQEGRLEGLALGLGARYKGAFWLKEQFERFDAQGNFTGERNQIEVEDSLVLDAMIEYKTRMKGIDARFSLNVQNLLDERYYATGVKLNSAIIPGDALKVFFSVDLRL